MDLSQIGPLLGGGLTLAGGLVLALVRYLASDTGYRELISEQRKEIEQLRQTLSANQRRESWMMAELVRLGGRMPPPDLWGNPPPPPPSWPPPKGST